MVCFMKFRNTDFSSSNHQKNQKKTSFLSNKVAKALPLYRMIKLTAACSHPQRPILSHTQNPVVHLCICVRKIERGSAADWMTEACLAWKLSPSTNFQARHVTAYVVFPVSWQRSWIMYLSVCLSVSSTGHWRSCQLVISSLQVKMTCGGAGALALSPCPALDRRRCTQSLPVAYRKVDRGDRGGGNEPQCSPNPPKWNWQARWSNCSQHYFLWQEILLSTNRGFNKRQEMRL